jgi:peptidoglycan/xylan/chitin deacetylase (PgdA/CDA1 family)
VKNNYLKNKTLGLFVKTNGVISRPLFSGLGHILCFHRVVNPDGRQRLWANSGKEISEEKLRFIIKFFLEKGYEFISMDELHNRLSIRKKSKKFVVVTFDDGYADNYTHAFPLFKELGIPFTIYVATGMPDGDMVLWPYFLEEHLLKTELVKFNFINEDYEFQTSHHQERETVYNAIRNIILQNEAAAIPFFMDNVFQVNESESMNFTKGISLSWSQISELSKNKLVTIGAHGKKHFALSKLSDAYAREEIMGSKKRLEEKLQIDINHFAYPYGTYNEISRRDLKLVKDAGFKTGVTLLQGNLFKSHNNITDRLPRIPLGNHVNEELLNNIENGIRHYSFNGCKKNI